MFKSSWKWFPVGTLVLGLGGCGGDGTTQKVPQSSTAPSPVPAPAPAPVSQQDALPTSTPIKHLVVIYNENVSFDHYFATYPIATNPSGEPAFTASPGTPQVNGLSEALLSANPNYTNNRNGTNATEPFRIDRSQAATGDQNHGYTAEQEAYDNGSADLFPLFTGHGTPGAAGAFGTNGLVMGYFDGNTVTAYWNYAQRFAMSDSAYTDTYGPSTPGALEVVSGQTNGLQLTQSNSTGFYVNDTQGGLTLTGDFDPAHDICTIGSNQGLMTSQNIGDLLNASQITWGGFMGGFNLATTNANGTTGCKRSTLSPTVGATTTDYIPHHAWFQYFASTANPQHLRPSATSAVGHSFEADGKTPDPANHDYDSDDFFASVAAGNFPSVSFIKAQAFQDGHAGYSDPLDEQSFVAKVVNMLQQQPGWKNTVVIVTYDDSDGWYDHAYAAPTSASFDASSDRLNGIGLCGTGPAPNGLHGVPVNGRCGPGTRVPFLVISPWSKPNYVDHAPVSQASIVRFIEDNWLGGKRLGGGSFDATAGSLNDLFNFSGPSRLQPLYVDPTTGSVIPQPPAS